MVKYIIRYVVSQVRLPSFSNYLNFLLQVDVHVCSDKSEYDRISFFHSYGDMGMILGLIARNSGLALGLKGLKVRPILLCFLH
jgi:hypothetical protein